MKSLFSVSAVIALLAPVVCAAQIYQCRDASGRVTMQQTPCAGDQTGRRVMAPSAGQTSTPPAQSADARQLTALVAEAIARKDYPRAESLAVTAEHWSMISAGRQRDAENQRAAREERRRNRPAITNCNINSGQMHCITN